MIRVWVVGISLLLVCVAANAQQTYSDLISFGDSLSDTGNLASATIDFPSPYYRNRISNGLVALDHFAASLDMSALASAEGGNNFAVAGGNIEGNSPEDLSSQIMRYLIREDFTADADALYFVMMGGNDLRGIRSIFSAQAAQMIMDGFVASYISELTRLSDAGAKHFFVANVANIGGIPETLERESSDPGVSDRAEAYSRYFNAQLAIELQAFSRQTTSSIVIFDTFATGKKIAEDPARFGFSNGTEGCFDADEILTPPAFGFHPDCLFGSAFNEFVFFDNLHPTAATHQIIGNAMIQSLEEVRQPKSIPLAAIIMLLLDE